MTAGVRDESGRNQRRRPNQEARIHMQASACPSRSPPFQQHHLKVHISRLKLAAPDEPLPLPDLQLQEPPAGLVSESLLYASCRRTAELEPAASIG